MEIKLIENKIIVSAESVEEKDKMSALIEKYENLIFQLQFNNGSIEFVNLGKKEDACNTSINVTYSNDNEEIRKVSNLAYTPFLMDDIEYNSVEAFWQSLKYKDSERTDVRKLHGKEAKKSGNRVKYTKFIRYQQQKIRVGSQEHWDLMYKACENKFTQNEDAQSALLNTGIRPLYHKPRKDSVVIPGSIMAGMWMNIRSKLRREKNMESKHLNFLK
ncbi:MAG TPA: NADAR family protein [Bacteroidetes bacterium]|nr:NADAR family protein [Bacteroidota bacterium]